MRSSRAPAQVSPPAPAAAVQTTGDDEKAPPGFHFERHFRRGFITSGAVTFGVGWLMGILVSIGGAAYSAAVPKNTCWSSVSTVGWIPFFGPALAIGGLPAHKAENGKVCTDLPEYLIPGVAVAVISTLAQVVGAGLMVLGFTWRMNELVPNSPQASHDDDDGMRLALRIGTTASPLGITVGLTNF